MRACFHKLRGFPEFIASRGGQTHEAARWALFHLRLWVFELRLWMDGLPWEDARLLAEQHSKDLPRPI